MPGAGTEEPPDSHTTPLPPAHGGESRESGGDLPARVAAGLAKLSLALRYQSWREATSYGLTPTQGQVLSWLHLLSARSRRTPGELARALALTPATVSEVLNALERKGLVRRRPLAEDRRSVSIDLSEEGQRIAREATGWADFLASAVGSLSTTDQLALLRILIQLIRQLQEQGQIPVARMCVTCQFFRPFVHQDAQRPHHCLYVDAPLGDGDLRLDCPDYEAATPAQQQQVWGIWQEQAAVSRPGAKGEGVQPEPGQ